LHPKKTAQEQDHCSRASRQLLARDIQGNLGIHEVRQYLKIWRLVEHTHLTDQPDQLTWKWTADGDYSAKSCYLSTFPWINHFRPLEVDLEDMGTSTRQVLHLAGHEEPLLDRRQAAAPSPATSSTLHPLRPGTRDYAPLAHHLLLLEADMA
jgi:hypothetical protein